MLPRVCFVSPDKPRNLLIAQPGRVLIRADAVSWSATNAVCIGVSALAAGSLLLMFFYLYLLDSSVVLTLF